VSSTPLWKRGARWDLKLKKVYLKIPRCLCSGEFSFSKILKEFFFPSLPDLIGQSRGKDWIIQVQNDTFRVQHDVLL